MSDVQPSTCPFCHRQLADASAIELGEWRLWPELAERHGTTLKLTRAEAGILFRIAQDCGKIVPAKLVAEHFSRSRLPANTVRVLLTRIRKKLGEDCPIETIHGRGYRWKPSASAAAKVTIATTGGT